MHIPRCDNRFIQLFPYFANLADYIAKLIRACYKTLVHQVHVHGQWLNLQHIIKMSNLHGFLSRFVEYCFKKLSTFTTGNYEQSISMLFQLGFRNTWYTFEIFRM
ncbi:hypothetical protein D3C71_1463530 [compost metagenome]